MSLYRKGGVWRKKKECGASLIAPGIVLTAAHCAEK
jgi:secreted trypsin-like serine protease